MDGVTLLNRARAAGLTVAADGDRIVIKGPKRAGAIAKELTDNKAVVLAALTTESAPPPTGGSAIEDAAENDQQAQQHHAEDAETAVQASCHVALHRRPAGSVTAPHSTDSIQDRCNKAYCDMLRLAKATVRVAIIAGNELAAAKRELGDGFDEFVATRMPWNMSEAAAAMRFVKEVGLQPDRLTPAHEVSLARLLEATGLLGGLYLEQTEGFCEADEAGAAVQETEIASGQGMHETTGTKE